MIPEIPETVEEMREFCRQRDLLVEQWPLDRLRAHAEQLPPNKLHLLYQTGGRPEDVRLVIEEIKKRRTDVKT